MAEKSYPGDAATPQQVQALADEYRAAAAVLRKRIVRRGAPLSRGPFHLTAIHAIELYLDAFLLRRGRTPATIRKLQHDLGGRAELAVACGLNLRRGTAHHLRNLSVGREYVVSRYAPELAESMSQLNRLEATLEDVANKVSKAVVAAAEDDSSLSARYSPRV